MKKCFLLTSIIFLFFISALAQTDSEKPIEWKPLSPENEEFSVDAPDNLAFYSYDDKNESRRFSGITDGTYFFIFSDKIASDPKKTIQYNFTLKFIEAFRKPEMESQKNSNRMKFIFSDDENFFHTIYAVKTKNRAYIFHLVSQKEDDPNVERFFRNLKVNKKSAGFKFENDPAEKSSVAEFGAPGKLPIQNKNPEQQKTTSGTITGQSNGRGSGIGNGVGNGIGNGEGSGFGNGTGTGRGSGIGNGTNSGSQNDENKISENKDLSITFKPKPRYTELARFYGITGSVRVKMTFLSNGTISSTTALTKLPFGLTAQAVSAAKQMRFDPKLVKGNPVSVTKVVVFNFTIY